MLETLVVVETVALFFGVPLLFLYLRERVKNLAREETDKALADYTHKQEQRLETEKADHQRRLREFGLFTQKQHEVYAQMYRRVRIAAGRFSSLVGITMSPDFKKYERRHIEEYVKRRKLSLDDARGALIALENGNSLAVEKQMDDLHTKANRRDAEAAFVRAKSYEAVNELYFSDDVRTQVHAIRRAMAGLSVALRHDDGTGRELERQEEVDQAVARLFHIMCSELRKGE